MLHNDKIIFPHFFIKQCTIVHISNFNTFEIESFLALKIILTSYVLRRSFGFLTVSKLKSSQSKGQGDWKYCM
jgi:hypothetical protein